MSGKVARQLRKLAEIDSKEKRTYQELSMPTEKLVYQFDGVNNKVNTVKRKVNSKLIECTSGKRKLYKFFKKKYNNSNEELVLNQLPSTEALDEIRNQIRHELSENSIPAATGGGLLSPPDSSGRIEIEEGGLNVESPLPSSEG